MNRINEWGTKSLKIRDQLHPNLQLLVDHILKRFNISLLVGYRSEAEQNEAFAKGFSKLKYPLSKHNTTPYSNAVDFAIYKNGKILLNREDVIFISGYALAKAEQLGIKIRVGALWNNEFVSDNKFLDAFHIELI